MEDESDVLGAVRHCPADAREFVTELGRALLVLGTPAHRLEEALALVCRRLGLEGEFFSTPTALIATFLGESPASTRVVRCDPGDVNLEKLVRIDAVTNDVVAGRSSTHDGASLVHEILSAPRRFGNAALAFCYGVSSLALAFVFGGDWRQALVAGGIGLAVGGLGALSDAWQGFGRVFEFVAAFVTSILAHAAMPVAGANSVYLTTVTGLIVLMPGLTLTVALTELSTRNLVSGTARLMGAGITFLKLGFGVAVGGRLAARLFAVPEAAEPMTAALWVEAAALLVAALSFTAIFQARPRDSGWILLASAASLVGYEVGIRLLGPHLGPCLGAFLATAGSNALARRLDRPARVTLLPSLVLLVPGSVGFRAVSLLLEQDAIKGVGTAFNMALGATALVAGVLFGNLLVRPRGAL